MLSEFGVLMLTGSGPTDNVAILLPNYFCYPFLRIGNILIVSVIVNVRLVHVPIFLLNFAFVRVLVAACVLQGRAVHLWVMVHESAARRSRHLLLVVVGGGAQLHPGRADIRLHLLGREILPQVIVRPRMSRWIIASCSTCTTGSRPTIL